MKCLNFHKFVYNISILIFILSMGALQTFFTDSLGSLGSVGKTVSESIPTFFEYKYTFNNQMEVLANDTVSLWEKDKLRYWNKH